MKKIAILGSTGSIGTQTLEVVRNNPELQVVALAAGKSVEQMEQQIREFHPLIAGMWSEEAAADLRSRVADLPVKVVSGMDGLLEIATMPQSQVLVTAIVGMIGIRPTIDGRRGPIKVRQSLEDQTMGMAKAAAKLFEENIKYSNGEPVKVVIADTTIGRVAEAAACEEKFRREGVAITLTVTPCWCYGSETMDMDPTTIKGVWGLNATERPGAVYLASVLATHAQKGLPAFGIYGHDVVEADDSTIGDDIKEKLLRFGRAAVAAATMRGKSYLQIGSICMGIGGSIIDSDFMESYLGMRVESVDEAESSCMGKRKMQDGL